jgi:hypothetical protein
MSSTETLASDPLAAEFTSQTLARLLFQIVAATEDHDPRLAELNSQIAALDAEMKDLRFSVGWEFDVRRQETEYDATRRAVRRPLKPGQTGRPGQPYDVRGDYDRDQDDLILRLRRSFLGPDHEKYVKIAQRRLDKMTLLIKKQEIRREIHLASLQAALDVLYRQTILPVLDQQIALARREIELLAAFQKVGDVLHKDRLEAEKQLRGLEEQRQIHRNSLILSLNELRQKTGLPNLTLPTTLPLVAGSSAPPAAFDPAETTSRALTGRTDYFVAQRRMTLADQMASYMAWYYPRVDVEFGWDKYSDRRRFLNEARDDVGWQFFTELGLNVPLNLPYRGLKRREAFRAVHESYARQMDQMRMTIENQILRTYLDRQQAEVHRAFAASSLAQAAEETRHTELLAQQLPEEIQGIAEVKQLEARIKMLEARVALCNAEHELLRAQARWNYQMGESPIDEAVAPYEEKDRRADEEKGWLKWWTNLIRW